MKSLSWEGLFLRQLPNGEAVRERYHYLLAASYVQMSKRFFPVKRDTETERGVNYPASDSKGA